MAATESLGTFAGPAGVGALFFLGLFLFLDGRAPKLFPAFESYAKTATWTVVAAVPLLAITYVAGLVLITAASAGVRITYGPSVRQEAEDTFLVSTKPAKESVLSQRYLELQQQRDILAGAALSLVLLALGALSERNTLRIENAIDGWLVLTGACCAILGSVALFMAAGARANQAHTFATVGSQLTSGLLSNVAHASESTIAKELPATQTDKQP